MGTEPSAPPPPLMPPTAPVATGRPTNTLAIVSLVAGVASYIGFFGIGAIVAIITGHMARRQIKQTGEAGDGLAFIGLILGYVHLALLALVLVGIILVVAFVGIAASQRTG
ncbi:MAG: DUF4190 domain-containing protein [Chloroflexi bacterium]|nr:MAG: DUF4190 domain-containing protein [Chloroflexota bacterium]TME16352.1 MAG: DUF4190 domain-containing protein [Chloroflexota bacterium]TME19091.1 MAG: DUF4190 domain-containing protein [Chloroflexota bacterium]